MACARVVKKVVSEAVVAGDSVGVVPEAVVVLIC